MSFITYTAKRGLVVGHTVGTDYNLEFGIQQNDKSGKTKKKENRGKGQSALVETLRFHHERFLSVKTLYIDEVDLENWQEWFQSVDGGEAFTYDPTGTIAVPVAPILVQLVGDTYVEEQITFHRASIAFRVRY